MKLNHRGRIGASLFALALAGRAGPTSAADRRPPDIKSKIDPLRPAQEAEDKQSGTATSTLSGQKTPKSTPGKLRPNSEGRASTGAAKDNEALSFLFLNSPASPAIYQFSVTIVT